MPSPYDGSAFAGRPSEEALARQRAAEDRLRQLGKERSAAGGTIVDLAGTGLGALAGFLATGFNPAGAAAGAALGHGLTSGVSGAAGGGGEPGAAGKGVTEGLSALDRLLKLRRKGETGGGSGPGGEVGGGYEGMIGGVG